MDKGRGIKGPNGPLSDRKDKLTQSEPSLSNGKDPAIAYSYSVLFWGGGQFYNNQSGKGLSFLFLMTAFYAGIALTALSWSYIVSFLQDHGVSVSAFLLFMLALLLFGLIFGCLCRSDAYHRAAKARKDRFTGTESRIAPFLCSILLPGWGQFLNGQILKGSIFASFSVVSYFSLITVPVVLLAWKDLEPSFARFLVESVFTTAILILPFIPLIWLFSSYDALKVSLDGWKKKPLWERIRAAHNLRRNRVWAHRLRHRIKQVFVLALIFLISLIVLYDYFPERFYLDELASAQLKLQTKGMTLLPDLMEKWLLKVSAGGMECHPISAEYRNEKPS